MKTNWIGCLLCAGVLTATAQAGTPPALLVLEKTTQTLAIIDPASLHVLARVPAGPDPHEVVASSDGTRAYISNYGGEGSDLHTLSVVDLYARKALTPIDLGALRSAHGLDFAGGEVYFTAETAKAIGRYDPQTRRIEWVLGTGQDGTHMVQVASDLKHLYASNVRSGTISLISASEQRFGPFPPAPPGASTSPPGAPRPPMPASAPRTLWEATTVPAGQGSEGFDVSPDSKELWAANARDATVTVIDLAAKKAVATVPIPVTGANRLKFTLDGRNVLISGLGSFGRAAPAASGSDLVVLDATTHEVVKRLDLGGGSAGILLDPDRSRAFVAVSRGNQVAVIDLHRLEVVGHIAPMGEPDGMAWAPGT
jgi:DNA-binding beta-propeller fold protein YncE